MPAGIHSGSLIIFGIASDSVQSTTHDFNNRSSLLAGAAQ